MAVGPKTMGYQGLVYYGTKGSTANTLILCRRDATYEVTPETGDTTCAGDGTAVPINTGEATALGVSFTFNMIINENASAAAALAAAAATGDPIALRYIRKSGAVGLDADCVISVSQGSPLRGEATMDVTVQALSEELRTPVLNG